MKNRFLAEIKGDVRDFFGMFPFVFKEHRRCVLLFSILLMLLLWGIHPYDTPWVQKLLKGWPPPHLHLAEAFRTWGDFRDIVTITAVVMGAGWIFKRRDWRQLAAVFFLTVCLAGMAANTIRFTAGRPRPYISHLTEDRFYGPFYLYPESKKPADGKFRKFQSFPSGHSTTSSTAAVMMLVAAPVLGAAVFLSAVGILWSSLYCCVHYATDVTAGIGFGMVFGSIGGLVYRRMKSKVSD